MSKYEELKVKLRDWRLSLQSDNKEAMLLAANAIESLERQLAKQDVEIARLKTVPMKYRRMEFNAQLQHKNTKLEAQLATVTAQRNSLEGALELMLERIQEPPDSNCSCHISPPCNDCVDFGGEREAFEVAKEALASLNGE